MQKVVILSDDSQRVSLRIDETGTLKVALEVLGQNSRLWPTVPLAEAVVYDKFDSLLTGDSFVGTGGEMGRGLTVRLTSAPDVTIMVYAKTNVNMEIGNV